VLVLGYRSSEVETGLYALASTLSSQANTLVAAQLGTVLQPIFGHLDATRGRQFAGFTRVLRTIGVIAVPITLIQAASAGPLFQLAFDPSWLGAVTVFAILSVMESFYFATAPTMAVLRAQRRFRTYFFWQVGHFCVAAVLYWIVAPQYGSIGVAGVSLLCWGCSATLAVWLVAPRSGRSASAVTRIFLTPIAITLPCAVCVYWSGQQLQVLGTAGQVMSLAVLSPCALILCFILLRRFQPVAWVDIDNLLVVVRTRLVRK
jgi:O-antigen/teichoic acid export membrane protein